MKTFFKALLSLIILAFAAGASWWLYQHQPKAAKSTPERPVPVVRTVNVQPGSEPVVFEASGTVVPAGTAVLRSEVEGRIIEQNPELIPGGIVSKGDLLIRIDPRDYQFQVRERQAELATARYELEVEQGRQTIAQQEWRILEKEVSGSRPNRDLALRKPHLRHAEAGLAAAESRLAAAELAEQRTSIRAPFTGIVLEENVEKGQFVGRQSTIATLVAVDVFRVQVAVPISLLDRIRFPGTGGKKGSRVEVIMEKGYGGKPLIREGSVFKLLADLDPKGRMARILVTVEDPLGLAPQKTTAGTEQQGRLLLGSFVKVRINAGTLDNVCVIQEKALREGSRLWLVDKEGLFDAREVRVLWRRADEVLVDADIAQDERVIISRLQTPIPGMQVREE